MSRLDEIKREVSIHALDAQWREEIDKATTELALVALARRFMMRPQTQLAAGIPPPFTLPRLVNAGDVSLVTYRLRRLYCSPSLDESHIAFVEQAVAFFDALCERIFEMRFQEESRQRPLPPLISASG
jgi:hypothetical protein